jgi:hypothetical protein
VRVETKKGCVGQIEANRRNARKSTGPRSASGKQRASRNAYRPGLSKPMLGPEFTRAVEALGPRMVGDNKDRRALASAREVAERRCGACLPICSRLSRYEIHSLRFPNGLAKHLAKRHSFDRPAILHGVWSLGRPDMAMFIFARAILAGEPIKLFKEIPLWVTTKPATIK